MSHRIEFSPEALGDLIDLYDYIALHDGAERAIGYIDRVILNTPTVAAVFLCFRIVASGATICAPACGFSASNAAP